MASLWLTLVITCIIFGYAGNVFAKKTGRDPVRWTILGVALNVLILGVIFIVGEHSKKIKSLLH
jgi:hypothetical protein